MTKRILFFFLLTLLSYDVLAQYVQGVVLDDALGDPLPGAHVFYLEDKSTMQVTDYNGHFKIPVRKGTLQVSMMGFAPYTVAISGTRRLSVRLKETSSQMKEVEIKVKKQKYSRKNNPAVEMMKKVIAAKTDNDLHRNDFFSYHKYEKITFSLNEFTEKVFEDDHFKRFPQLREHVEYCPETGKLILPLMVQEQVMRRVYRKNPKTEKTIIDGKRDNGVNEFFSMDMIETIIGDLFREIDIYKDNVRFMQQEFVSPISTDHAIAFYRYFIIDTLEQIKDLPFRMFFVGTGYAAEEMKRLVREKGLDDKTTFVGVLTQRDQIKKYYAVADLFLFPSLYDNAPLVVREAAALHTPAVMVQGSTAATILQDGYNGFLIENSIESFENKLRGLAADRDLVRRAGIEASHTIVRSWENVVDEVLDRYRALIERKKMF